MDNTPSVIRFTKYMKYRGLLRRFIYTINGKTFPLYSLVFHIKG